jgi:hypothetical protein
VLVAVVSSAIHAATAVCKSSLFVNTVVGAILNVTVVAALFAKIGVAKTNAIITKYKFFILILFYFSVNN